ncbi:hypothetical protein GCM10009017_24800 [Halarchaeum rubridurum]|uniref:Uncharacterized protein n=1 Tax=Halarchaeum rubridurum TaxID=489911 RepID=A0A830G3S0_9EURY|nr:hypothetical protein GCM10009017_24800 [Halarchaeum rubridurum]
MAWCPTDSTVPDWLPSPLFNWTGFGAAETMSGFALAASTHECLPRRRRGRLPLCIIATRRLLECERGNEPESILCLLTHCAESLPRVDRVPGTVVEVGRVSTRTFAVLPLCSPTYLLKKVFADVALDLDDVGKAAPSFGERSRRRAITIRDELALVDRGVALRNEE